MFNSIIRCLPVLLLPMVTAYAAGVIIWILRFTMENSDSCSAEKDYLRYRPVAGTSQSAFNLNPSIAETSRRSNQTQSRMAESPLVQNVFNMSKSSLEVKLEEKGKQIERKSGTDKQVGRLRFKGNQKQFEHNAKLDSVLDRIREEADGSNVAAVESLTSIRASASGATDSATGQGIAVMHGSAKVLADPIMPAWPTCLDLPTNATPDKIQDSESSSEGYEELVQIVFAARPWKLAPAQVMVDRCVFVKMLVKSRADSTAK
ncbi:uncharacterized protein [Montipora capricornis]|uniref:uncharacterized protein n=2 Tax=Montipora TaxID=46703 RepID=UPI0035F11DA4